MLEFLAMPERLIGGVRRGCCPGTAPPPHVPEPEPLSLPVEQSRPPSVRPRILDFQCHRRTWVMSADTPFRPRGLGSLDWIKHRARFIATVPHSSDDARLVVARRSELSHLPIRQPRKFRQSQSFLPPVVPDSVPSLAARSA
jgi:hypothetical protein